MVATYSKRLRALQQEQNSNVDSWGPELNIGAIERLDEGWATSEVVVAGNVTLDVEQGISDQARSLVLILTGAGGFTVTHPEVDKPYLVVNNCVADVTLKPQAGSGAVIRAGKKLWYYTNSAGDTGYVIDPRISDFLSANANIDMGGFRIINIAPGVDPGDVATVGNIEPYATAAAASAAAALVSENNADADEQATRLLYNDFQKRYLGAYTTDPTTDNLGNPLTAGALYFNNATLPGVMRVYNGAVWNTLPTFTLSSQPQAEAGVDNSTIMTPLRVKQAIDALVIPKSPYSAGLVSTVSVAVPAVDVSINATKKKVRIDFDGVKIASGGSSLMIQSDVSGNTFSIPISQSTTYANGLSAAATTTRTAVTTGVPIAESTLGNDTVADRFASGWIEFSQISGLHMQFIGRSTYKNSSSNLQNAMFGGQIESTSAIAKIRFKSDSGNITAGRFVVTNLD